MALKYNLGFCSKCESDNIKIVKKLPSGNLCHICNNIRLLAGKIPDPLKESFKPPKAKYVYQRKPTGEMVLFRAIWDSLRTKTCEVCNSHVEFTPHTFSHILSKGSHPAFKLLMENISIMCFDCHYSWDNVAKSNLTDRKWELIKDRANELKILYNKK